MNTQSLSVTRGPPPVNPAGRVVLGAATGPDPHAWFLSLSSMG